MQIGGSLFGMQNMEMKMCPGCKTLKSVNEFSKNITQKDGLHAVCKKCKNAGNKKYYKTEKGRATHKKWYSDNLERLREYNNKLRKKYQDKYNERARKYAKKRREANPNSDYVINWQRANVDKIRAIKHAYRTRKSGNGGSFTDKEWKDLCDKYDNKCLCCGNKTKLTADHVIPVIKGGTSNIDNIQPLCLSCNSSKHTKETDYRK